MEDLYYIALLLITLLALKKLVHRNSSKKLAPSPPSLPFFGHLHLLTKEPYHRTLKAISDRYGPVVYLRLGSLPVLLVSSPSAAERCFTENDIVFANRPKFMAGEYMGYNYTSVIWAPYGSHWTTLRRVAAVSSLSLSRVQQLSSIREEEVLFMARRIMKMCCNDDHDNTDISTTKVNLNHVLMLVTHNVVMRMVCGKQWPEPNWAIPTAEFASVCDFFPLLRWIGYKGEERKMGERQQRRDQFVQQLIDECRENNAMGKSSTNCDRNLSESYPKTMVEELLALQENDPEYFTDKNLRGIISITFTAGTDTTARTMEWGMSLLVNHPRVLLKARTEIETVIGHNRLPKDQDLSELPYLRCIVNETLRLYPIGPLLLPHCSSADCTVEGYHVPKGTVLLVNAMSIHRDPKVWEDAAEFIPERWYAKLKDEKPVGVDGFKFMPFGAGRRTCPGVHFATRLVTLALGTLIQCFEWENVGQELVDMEESGGISMAKLQSLEAVCSPRSFTKDLLASYNVVEHQL